MIAPPVMRSGWLNAVAGDKGLEWRVVRSLEPLTGQNNVAASGRKYAGGCAGDECHGHAAAPPQCSPRRILPRRLHRSGGFRRDAVLPAGYPRRIGGRLPAAVVLSSAASHGEIGPNGPVCYNSNYPCPLPNGQCNEPGGFDSGCGAPPIPPTDCCPACIAVYLTCNGACAAAAAFSDDPAVFEECNEACGFTYKGCQQDCALVQQNYSNWSPTSSTRAAPTLRHAASELQTRGTLRALIGHLFR